MKKIKLTQGKYALVDDKDFKYLSNFEWYALKDKTGNYYARRMMKVGINKQSTIQMVNVIMGPSTKFKKEVDHINGDTLDNQRKNLRWATRSENNRNRKLNKNNKSGYKGVIWHKKDKNWQAQARLNKILIHLGSYKNKEDAKKAYDKFVKDNFKEFVRQLT